MSRLLRLVVLASAAALSFAGPVRAEQLKVVASFSILTDFARNVGGDRVDITTLVGPDGDAHVYEPKPADAASVGNADLVLVNGLQFEGFLPRLIEASGVKSPVVEVSKGVKTLETKADHDHGEHGSHHHDHGAFDPHAWQSARNAQVYVKNIAEAFCQADEAGCTVYRTNADAYLKQLEALDQDIRSAVAAIPEQKRTIITSHDAFGYFEQQYGLTFLAPEGIATDAEASAADVAALINQVREDRASAVFVENITNPQLVEQIAGETGLKLGGALYSDALSQASGPAPTYLEMMRHNVATIRGAILGS